MLLRAAGRVTPHRVDKHLFYALKDPAILPIVIAAAALPGHFVARLIELPATLPGVLETHDLQGWNIGSGTVADSAHLVLNEPSGQNSSQSLTASSKRPYRLNASPADKAGLISATR